MKITLTIAATLALALSVAADELVNVQVACKGVDYDTLSPKALSFAAKALELTFNSVHKGIDGAILRQITATGPLLSASTKQLRGTDIVDLTFAGMVPIEATGNDDWGCRFCKSDDTKGVVYATERKAWEAEFASMVSQGTFEAFKGVSKCNIHLASATNEEAVNEEQDTVNINVDVQCDNIDFAEMSMRAITFSTKALKDTYNSVHAAMDGSKLDNVVMSGHRLRVGSMGNDDWGCRFCRKDDDLREAWDAISFRASALKTASLGNDDWGCRFCKSDDLHASDSETMRAWEKLFVARLHKDVAGDFKGVQDCVITVGSKESDLVESE